MANPHAVDPDSEDASNIMRVISVKNSCADKPVIVQLIRFNNKVRETGMSVSENLYRIADSLNDIYSVFLLKVHSNPD